MSKLYKELQFNNKESPVYMPNEIFVDLQKHIDKSKHIPFAYAYYYLISWLYRYTRYGSMSVDNKMIKKWLGYSPTYPEIDYLIKKNGILDSMEYTSTVKDYPVSWTFDDGDLEFVMLSDFEEDMQKYINGTRSRKYTVKLPIKAFHRQVDIDDVLDGTFYDISNTHLIPFEVFAFCMSKKDIGCTGFYIWSYLKMKNQLFPNGYDVSLHELAYEVGIPRSTLCEYMDKLRKYRMVDCYYNQEFFCLAIKEEDRNANTYKVNNVELFSDEPMKYEKIKFMKVSEYEKKLEYEKSNNIGNWTI